MIDAMVSGIFAGDPHQLSLRACFPKMHEMETAHGGLVRSMLATRKRRRSHDGVGAPAGRLTSFVGGMSDLIDGLTRSLDHRVRLSTAVLGVTPVTPERAPGGAPARGYTVTTARGPIDTDAIVLAGPASAAASLVRPFNPALSTQLSSIVTAPLAVVCLGFDAAALAADRGPLDGFGFLVPRSEGVRILGALWETSIYPHRARAGKALMRVMIGGARDPEAVFLNNEALLSIVSRELRQTMGLSVAPEFARIIRHTCGIPQYTTDHLVRLQRIESELSRHPGIFLAGNSYRGVSINACIAEAGTIADAVVAFTRACDGAPSTLGGVPDCRQGEAARSKEPGEHGVPGWAAVLHPD
jgi:oxygen-dependent protoporphyrinogen oxidase